MPCPGRLLALAALALLPLALCQDSSQTCSGSSCDAWNLLQKDLGAGKRSLQAASELQKPQIPISFVTGDALEVKDWLQCSVVRVGPNPGALTIRVASKSGGFQDIPNVPLAGLRKAGKPNSTPADTTAALALGEKAEVFGWNPAVVTARGKRPGSYSVAIPKNEGPRRLEDVPLALLRKVPNPHWLHSGDPAVPSVVPGQDGGVCRSTEACAKIIGNCVDVKKKKAADSCGGGPCDLVFVGDSILERLTGWLCFSNNNRFQDSRAVFQELVAKNHPKSLILAGSCDETSQTMYMLDKALPVLKAPRAYFVMIGTNNIPKGGSAHAIRGIKAVVSRLRAEHPNTHLLLHALLPRADDGPSLRFQAHIDEVNAELAEYVQVESGSGAPIEFVDCSDTLFPHRQRSEDFDNIMLHPSPAGYRAWLSCVSPVLDRTLSS